MLSTIMHRIQVKLMTQYAHKARILGHYFDLHWMHYSNMLMAIS